MEEKVIGLDEQNNQPETVEEWSVGESSPETPPTNKRKRKKSIKRLDERISLNIICGIFIVYGITLAFPFLWLLYNSVKNGKTFIEAPMSLPKFQEISKNWENYTLMFKQYDMGTMFYNSLFLALASPTVSIFCHMCTAYAYSKHEFKLKRALYILGITPMIVSVAGTLPTSYELIHDLGIYDNMYLWILTGTGGFGMNFLLLASVFQNISTTYREAAEMDGAGQWRIFLRIYVPQHHRTLPNWSFRIKMHCAKHWMPIRKQ